MSNSYSYTESSTFTVVNARHMATKVATDLKRLQRLFGKPSDQRIAEFEVELTELLKAGYLGTVTYGFRRGSDWIEPTLRYTARDLAGGASNDDDPGKIRATANVEGASFHSYLIYSQAWDRLSAADQEAFEKKLPFQRGGALEPGVSGYFADDRTYSSGGRALNRATVRSL
jgi:hypothetical protein